MVGPTCECDLESNLKNEVKVQRSRNANWHHIVSLDPTNWWASCYYFVDTVHYRRIENTVVYIVVTSTHSAVLTRHASTAAIIQVRYHRSNTNTVTVHHTIATTLIRDVHSTLLW